MAYEQQEAWAFCKKCYGLFFDGYDGLNGRPYDKGNCPAGGEHVKPFNGYPSSNEDPYRMTFNYLLLHKGHGVLPEEGPLAQAYWDYCIKCCGLYFSGYNGGICPEDRQPHVRHPEAFRFLLVHDVPPRYGEQPEWDFCIHCHGLFYNHFPRKGVCTASPHGVHERHPDAYRFNLRFNTPASPPIGPPVYCPTPTPCY